MRIGKRFTFEAAHHLPLHDGKCRRPHGHSYVVEVELTGPVETHGPKTGMVYDFSDVSAAFRRLIFDRLDHQNLNAVLDFPTTAESLAVWMLAELKAELDEPWPDDPAPRRRVTRVRVWETATSWAEAEA